MKTKTRNYLLLFAGILLLSVFVTATNYIDNSKGQVSKTLTNDSGMYYNDGNSYRGVSSGTADVVVCRGLNAYDDIYKSVKWASGCDVVCKSTDNDCASEIQQGLTNKGIIIIKNGNYNLQTDLTFYSNTSLDCQNSMLNITGNYNINTVSSDNLNNVEIKNCIFNSRLITNSGQLISPLFNFSGLTSANNINFDNIEINNFNNTAFYISSKTSSTGIIQNIYLNNIRMNEVEDGIHLREANSLNEEKVKNVYISNINLNNPINFNDFYNQNGNTVFIVGGLNINLNNIYSYKGSDGPSIRIDRSHIVNVNNIYDNFGHDYSVSFDSDTGVILNNLYATNPSHWGPLLITNTNYNDGSLNIKATNINCNNCNNSGSTEYPILINNLKTNSIPLRNIEISNFYINNSKNTFGSIGVIPLNGNIESLNIHDGIIENAGATGIFFGPGNETKRLTLNNIYIKNNAQMTTDNEKKSGVLFSGSNTTNALISNIYLENNTNTSFYNLRFSNQIYFSGILDNIVPVNYLYQNIGFLGSNYDIYADNYKWLTNLPSCSITSLSYSRIQSNITKSYYCNGTSWNALY